jgi:hypothetical protein
MWGFVGAMGEKPQISCFCCLKEEKIGKSQKMSGGYFKMERKIKRRI